MTTILGQNISTVRPSLPFKPLVHKNERPRPRYKCRCKTNINARVKEVVIKDVFDNIFGLAKGTHYQVCEHFNVDFDNIKATGWKLDDGSYYWR